jgi:pyrimidine deaminase RibD-like protein
MVTASRMAEDHIEFMEEAIVWAEACKPNKPGIPLVGAIIVADRKVIGRGRRGTGAEGDDEHAEKNAFASVKAEDRTKIAGSTLYTTLEPCTGEVRSIPHESCTELILQNKIRRVFIGILDPNQAVTGKGLWRLQDNNIEVALFPHGLSQKIRVHNSKFIALQGTLGAQIISPKNGDEIPTYKTGGKVTLRVKCVNPPTTNTYLLSFAYGQCFPQLGTFRPVDDLWEIDAHFGGTGPHTLQMVTANDLGNTLIAYYKKVVDSNKERRLRLKDKVDPILLGGDYYGIVMNGAPKGFRVEASVGIMIAKEPAK